MGGPFTAIPGTSTFGGTASTTGLGFGGLGTSLNFGGLGGISSNPGNFYNGFPSVPGTATSYGLQGSLGAMPNFGLGGGGFSGIFALGALMGPIFALINLMAQNRQHRRAEREAAAEKAAKDEKKNQCGEKEEGTPNLKPPSFAEKYRRTPSPNGVSFPISPTYNPNANLSDEDSE